MTKPHASITLVCNYDGTLRHLHGDRSHYGLIETVGPGEPWWPLFPDTLDQSEAQTQFLARRSGERIQCFTLKDDPDRSFKIEMFRLTPSGEKEGDFAITLFEPAPQTPERDCSSSAEMLPSSQTRDLFRLALKSAQQVAWTYDLRSGGLQVQGGDLCILGYGFGEIEPTDTFWWERVPPSDKAKLEKALKSCELPGVDEWELEHRYRDFKGDYRWVKNYGKVSRRAADGRCLEMVGITSISNFVERERAFEQVKHSEQLLSEMSRTAKIGGWSYNVAADKLEWSREVYNIVEVEPDYVPTVADAIKRFPDEALKKIDEALQQAIKEGIPYFLDLPFVTEKGNWRWVRTTGFAETEDGETTRIYGVFQDITETDRVKRDLQAFFQTSADLLLIMDFDGHLRGLSDSWSETLGYPKEHLQKAPFMELVHPEDREATKASFLKALEGNPMKTFENRYRHADGHYLWLSWTSVSDLESKQVRAAARDVTDIKNLNVKLADALLASNAANEAKSRFLAVASHELRTPLNPILGYAEMLADEIEDPDHLEMLQAISNGGNRLLRTIEKILDVSSIESGTYTLKKDTVAFSDFCRELEARYQPQAQAKGIKLQVQTLGNPEESLILDGDLLRNALFNLISNAIKFTETGCVEVRLETSVSESSGTMDFSVSDSGIGIDETTLKNLFDPFTQADSSDTRKFGGLGLGLSICRKSLEMLNGTFAIDSIPSKGTHCYGQIPFRSAPCPNAAPARKASPKINSQTKILVVDDERTNRLILTAMIKNLGATPDEAHDAESALAAVAAEDYDLVFMDIHFPGTSGLKITEKIRSNPDIRQPYIAAVTADVINSRRSVCIEHGMDNYLSKPITLEKLQNILAEYLEQNKYGNLQR